MPKVFIVQNPEAGTHTAEKITEMIEKHFRQAGWDFQIHRTEEDEDLPAATRSAANAGFDLFVAAGGDGTISAVASGLAGTPFAIGILPIGTGNGLARDLGIPLKPRDALAVITGSANVVSLDAIKIDERYFLLNLSVGFTSGAIEEAGRQKKKRLGRLAYFLAGMHHFITGIQPHTFWLEIDGQSTSFRASEILIMNSVTIGDPGRFLELGIENDDGKLDLFVIRARTMWVLLRMLINLIFRRADLDPDIRRRSIQKSLKIDSRRALIVQADGEIIGHTPVRAELIPQAVRIIVPEAD